MQNNNAPEILPTRFDAQTRLSLMAALVFGLADPEQQPSVKDVVEKVIQLDDAVNKKLKELKSKHDEMFRQQRTQRS